MSSESGVVASHRWSRRSENADKIMLGVSGVLLATLLVSQIEQVSGSFIVFALSALGRRDCCSSGEVTR